MSKLQVTHEGDESVGIRPEIFELVTPINETDDTELIEDFRESIEKLYTEFCDGPVNVWYDFEYNKFNDPY